MKDLRDYNEPLVLWCYFDDRRSKIINAKYHENYHLNSQTPHKLIIEQPADISAIYEFGRYNWCFYQEPSAKFPNPAKRLGRVLYPADRYGTAMYQWEMNENDTVLSQNTFCSLNVGGISSNTEE